MASNIGSYQRDVLEMVQWQIDEILWLQGKGGRTQAIIDTDIVERPLNPYLNAIAGSKRWDVTDGRVIAVDLDSSSDRADVPWTEAERLQIRNILNDIESFANIKFDFYPFSSVFGQPTLDQIRYDETPRSNFQLVKQREGIGGAGHAGDPDNAKENWTVVSLQFSNAEDVWNPRYAWDLRPGTFTYEVVIHELGHALGLAHPQGALNGSVPLPGAPGLASTAMEPAGYGMDLGGGDVASFLALDIAALQHMYGANTVYARGPNTYELRDDTVWRCIWDTGDIDAIVYNGERNVEIDLRAAPLVGENAGGYLTKINGGSSGFTIAHGVNIENANGGNGDDELVGNHLENRLSGGAGNDDLQGGPGADTLEGGEGVDTVNYSDDEILVYTRSYGWPNITGPLVGYAQLSVDLGNGSAQITQHVYGTDTGTKVWGVYLNLYSEKLISIENVIGTSFGDIIRGDENSNVLSGGGGADEILGMGGPDEIIGGAGNDTLDGGGDIDVAWYQDHRAEYGVLAFNNQVVVGSLSEGLDYLTSIESIRFLDRPLSTTDANSPIEYIASYLDLMAAFGANSRAGFDHFTGNGYTEGRIISFDGLQYIASYGDLINVFHAQVAADPNPDIGAIHYILAGYKENRSPDNFDAAHYLALNADLQAAFGSNLEAATVHYITQGYFEDRPDLT